MATSKKTNVVSIDTPQFLKITSDSLFPATEIPTSRKPPTARIGALELEPAKPTLALPRTLTAVYVFRQGDLAAAQATMAHWNGIHARKDTCNPHGIDAPYVVTYIEQRELFGSTELRVTMTRCS